MWQPTTDMCAERTPLGEACIHFRNHIGCCEAEPLPGHDHGYKWYPKAVKRRHWWRFNGGKRCECGQLFIMHHAAQSCFPVASEQ